ncbi:MAG: flagellar transcriptional regulator FlhC [Burkholderiaceae bacterium]|nr:flagellar transcriptional regulator FlhC [Burkholderiaceae bacterium]
MSARTLLEDNRQVARAIELIGLGARLQMLQAETALPYERLLRLYKEVAGRSPSKGQLPFSTDWFVAWQPNIHASLFYNLFAYLLKTSPLDDVDAIVKAYRLYQAEIDSLGVEPMMSVTRAWRLVRFIDAGLLETTRCRCCGGSFVTHPHEIERNFVCGLCEPPARAGKARRSGAIQIH